MRWVFARNQQNRDFAKFWFIVSLAQALGKAWISNSNRIVTNITLGGQVLHTEVADDHDKNDNEYDDDKNRCTRARQGPLCGFPMSALWLLILDPLKLFLTLLENRVHLGHFRQTNATTFCTVWAKCDTVFQHISMVCMNCSKYLLLAEENFGSGIF